MTDQIQSGEELIAMNEPFGRQPKKVIVILQGEREDVEQWYVTLKSRAEYKGDDITGYKGELVRDWYQRQFVIHPRAVND